jgi:hypothetical protein
MTTSVGALLALALPGVFANGLWPAKAPDDVLPPFGVFLAFGGATRYYTNGPASDQDCRVQIDCWGNSYEEASTLADAVETAMMVHNVNASPSMFSAFQLNRELMPPDPNVDFQRIMLEFTLWYRP